MAPNSPRRANSIIMSRLLSSKLNTHAKSRSLRNGRAITPFSLDCDPSRFVAYRDMIDTSCQEAWKAVAIRTVLQLGDPGLREIASRVADPSAPEIRALVAEAVDNTDRAFGRLFAEARAAGELPAGVDPRALARMASAIIHTLSIRARARIPKAEILPIIDDAVRTICGPKDR